MSLRWSSYIAPKPGAQKRITTDFRLRLHFTWRNSATKFLCVKTLRQSYKAFIGLTIRAEIIGGGRPLLPEILGQSYHVGAKSPIFDLFALVATQP